MENSGEFEQPICDERGIPVFTDANQIDIKDESDTTLDRSINRTIAIPSIGEVEISLVHEPDQIASNAAKSKAFFASETSAGIMDFEQSIRKGLFNLDISLNQTEPYNDAQMKINVWLKGRSPKFSSVLRDFDQRDLKESLGEDGAHLPDRGKTTSASWTAGDGQSLYGLTFAPNFNVLKDLQISIEGITPQRGNS